MFECLFFLFTNIFNYGSLVVVNLFTKLTNFKGSYWLALVSCMSFLHLAVVSSADDPSYS